MRMLHNVSELKWIEGVMDRSVFRLIAEFTYDWENWHAPDGTVRWVNAAVERVTGYRPDECLRMSGYPLAMVAEIDRAKLAEVFRDAQEGGSGNDVEFQIVHRDGSARWGAISWQPIYDDTQMNLGFRASIRDVTDRQQLREQLRLHNRHLEQLVQERTAKIAQLEEHRLKIEKLAALGQLAAGIAHEVNNPLAGIRNAFALLRNSVPVEDANYELLGLIDSEIERISSITHQIYQLYRPTQQNSAVFDLELALSNVVVLLQPQATKAGVRIVVRRQKCEPHDGMAATEVVLREGELKQILLNIVNNAIEASPTGEDVVIQYSVSAEEVLVTVIDQGPGIPDELKSRVFEPFFSTKADHARQGMGLGLSVSQSLAEAMGGRITCEGTDEGTCIRLKLPRRLSCHE